MHAEGLIGDTKLQVLNAGSGPLAPKDIACQDGKAIPVVAADGLARFYMQLYVACLHLQLPVPPDSMQG